MCIITCNIIILVGGKTPGNTPHFKKDIVEIKEIIRYTSSKSGELKEKKVFASRFHKSEMFRHGQFCGQFWDIFAFSDPTVYNLPLLKENDVLYKNRYHNSLVNKTRSFQWAYRRIPIAPLSPPLRHYPRHYAIIRAGIRMYDPSTVKH